MTITIHGVNGIFTPDVAQNKNTDWLLSDLNTKYNIPIWEFKYPEVDVIATYDISVEIADAKLLINNMNQGDVVFAHSRGALVVWRACTMGAVFSNIYLLSAAAERSLEWPNYCVKGSIYNLYNPKDRVLDLTIPLIGNRMGLLGKFGSTVPDSRIKNINGYDMMKYHSFWGHADWFEPQNVDIFGKFIADSYNKF